MCTNKPLKIREKWPVYHPGEIELKWQAFWEERGLFQAVENSDQPKYYCLDFFPYPSGDGLHVGHCRNYVPTDVFSRFKRMQGYNVLHPMGWDSFGEPTEHYAVTHNVHPRLITDQNTANFRRQMKMIGASYDWQREIDSSQPEFYRWTQWFFLLMYQRGLAFRDKNWQWWCPTCQTTLSSHEVAGGVCWRGHSGITRREVSAWYFKITAYADELISGLEDIDWPENIRAMQRNWIGCSQGCQVDFRLETGEVIPVFTTRPDTLFGVTFLALAPEHPLVSQMSHSSRRTAVEAYMAQAMQKSEIERMVESREKTGVFTGNYAIHPLNGKSLPIWVADYVLPQYGTGALMGVPAHDQRDFDFAQGYGIPVKVVVSPPGYEGSPLEEAYLGDGQLIQSGPFNHLPNHEAANLITFEIQKQGCGGPRVQYRMHDWLISRQRYWGTPIPIVYCEICGEVPVPEDQLPVLLPWTEDFKPDGSGKSSLARLPEFVQTPCPICSGPASRETDTMGGFACSSWYFLRFTNPNHQTAPFAPEVMEYWMPVDLYVGGAEHAVLHLLYARFWTKVAADCGLVTFREPFKKLLNQGQLLAPDGSRMSKSRGNVISPESIVEEYGADALRIYELFIAPFEQDITWNTKGILGARRFLNRIWKMYRDTYSQSATAKQKDVELESLLNQTIQKVTQRMEDFRFNTVVSALMEFSNVLNGRKKSGAWITKTYHDSLQALLLLLAPVVPHIAEELWQLTGHQGSVQKMKWPSWDPRLAQVLTVKVAVQINGKVRDIVEVGAGANQEEVLEKALILLKVQKHLAEKQIARIVYIPDKIISIVTG